jgi:PAS domain S-box-containing protein
MMNKHSIEQILTRNVISVSPDTPISEAISLMEKNIISCLVIVDANKPVGIFTERDLILAMSSNRDLHLLKIQELIRKRIITASLDIDIFKALNIFMRENIRHLVVTDSKGELAGIVTQTDLRNNIGLEYFIEMKKTSEIMNKQVITTHKNSSVKDIILKMAENSISCVVVAQDKRPIGMITERDIVKLFLKDKELEGINVSSAMSQPVQTILPDIPILEASIVMNQSGIRRLVVVEEGGRISGLITQSDIIRKFEKKYVDILKEIIQKKEEELWRTKKILNEKIILENILKSSMNISVIASDINLRIIYTNPHADTLYDITSSKSTVRSMLDLFKESTKEQLRLREAVETARQGKEYKFIMKTANEDRVFIESIVSGIRDDDDYLVGFVLLSRDITEIKKTEEALKIKLKDLEDFYSMAVNREVKMKELKDEIERLRSEISK